MRRTCMTISVVMAAVGMLAASASTPALAAAGPYLPTTSLSATGPDQVTTESATGDLFVTEPGASKVLKLSPAGAVLGEITGAETPQGAFGLSAYHGLAVDNSSISSKGDVYVASHDEGASHEPRPVVDKFAPKAGHPNEYEYVCELVGSGAGCHKEAEKEGFTPTVGFVSPDAPLGVVVGASGEVFVAEEEIPPDVFEFGPAGEDIAGSPLFVEIYKEGFFPLGIAVNSSGDIYLVVANFEHKAEGVVEYNTEGKIISALAGAGAGSSDVAVNPTSGEVFVLNGEKGYVTRYKSTGTEIEKFGKGEVGGANRIAYNAENGDIYVTDEGANKIDVFAPEVTQPLTVEKEGTGAAEGVVDCEVVGSSTGPGTCAAEYPEGAEVELTEKPEGTTFEGWGGECSGTGVCKVTMSKPITVKATFKAAVLAEFPVKVKVAGEGEVTSTPAGIACGATCEAKFKETKEVTLTATPKAGWAFAKWSGEACNGSTVATCEFPMPAAEVKVEAEFVKVTTFPLNVFVTGEGEVNSTGAIKNCTSSGGMCEEQAKSEVTLTEEEKAGSGYAFAGWIGCKKATATECKIDVTAASEVTAVFLKEGKEGTPGKNGEGVKIRSFSGSEHGCTEGGVEVEQTNGTKTYVCSGAKGANGKEGVEGEAGPVGANGANGGKGANGSNGAAGAQGPAGPAGAQGPAGPAGKVELVTCKKVKGKQHCTTKLVSGTVKFMATGSAASAQATLSRHGAVYAAGTARSMHGRLSLRLLAVRKLRPGRYTLTLIGGSGKHATIRSEPFTLL